MLHQICQQGRLNAFIHNGSQSGTVLSVPLQILARTFQVMSPLDAELGAQQAVRTKLSIDDYELIFAYLNCKQPLSPLRHFQQFPHPLDVSVLSIFAKPVYYIKHKGRNFSTSTKHAGNSSISYWNQHGQLTAGVIASMWQLDVNDTPRTFIIVSSYERLSEEDQRLNPYSSRPGFLCTLVYIAWTACY